MKTLFIWDIIALTHIALCFFISNAHLTEKGNAPNILYLTRKTLKEDKLTIFMFQNDDGHLK